MTRPDAPLIEATAELLDDWVGPVVEMLDAANDDWQLAAWDPGMGESSVHGFSPDDDWASVWLDLRRPEVQDRWSRVRFGASGLELRGACLFAPHGLVAWDVDAMDYETEGRKVHVLHVPDLATLPDADTLAWACWHVEQAIRAGEGRDG